MHQSNHHIDFQSPATIDVPVINENEIIINPVASRKNYLLFKRIIDIVFSFLFTVLVLSWLLPIIAIWIKLDSKGPVFFWQKRTGINGKIFRCLKLRTMIQNDDADEKPAEENDQRITGAGRFLRTTNIDELPQMLNVLIGNMSLVGPRPHMLSDCTRFSFVVSSYQFRNLVKPGLTGLAQTKGHYGLAKDYDSIVTRYYWDAEYVKKAGLWLDMKIIGATIIRSISIFIKLFSDLFRKTKTVTATRNSFLH